MDITEGTRKVIELLDINPVKRKTVVLKPNFNTDDPTPGSNHNDTLRALILKVKEMGAAQIELVTGDGNSKELAGKIKEILQKG